MKANSDVEHLSNLLFKEVTLLSGFIERKGTQLRLEKAMLLTVQVFKIASRWKDNEFFKHFLQFDETLNPLRTNSSKKKVNIEDHIRLPSRQWTNWIIYLCLREICLLAKVNFVLHLLCISQIIDSKHGDFSCRVCRLNWSVRRPHLIGWD